MQSHGNNWLICVEVIVCYISVVFETQRSSLHQHCQKTHLRVVIENKLLSFYWPYSDIQSHPKQTFTLKKLFSSELSSFQLEYWQTSGRDKESITHYTHLISVNVHIFQVVVTMWLTCSLKWAKIILIIEQSLTTEARLQQQLRYSQPMKDARRALPIRWDRREGICSSCWEDRTRGRNDQTGNPAVADKSCCSA